MQSCLYEGTVRHRRSTPVVHEFQYGLYMAYVDLAEIGTLYGRHGLWSTRWPAIARFRRDDHLGDPRRPLDECVRELVESRLGWRPEGPIRLLTSFRCLGFQMNPISVYYCFDLTGEGIVAVVAEVNNTPWNERHCYVLDLHDQTLADSFTAIQPKIFHVSPFLKMELDYRWQVTRPGERLTVQITAADEHEALLDATLLLARRPLTRWQKFRLFARYPLVTFQVFAGIYWQALRLWRKHVPFVPHPGSIRKVTTAAQPANQNVHTPAP